VIRGIVLAAGASSRMGRPKAGLPLGPAGDTALSRLVRTLLAGGLPDVAVVAGAHVAAVWAAMPPRERRARLVEHPGWQTGQLSSLLAGLAAVDDPQLEAVMMTLVDVPMVRAETVREVVAAWRRTRAPIVRPADGARHGHPVIFDRAVFADLRAADPAVGAKAVFARHRAAILDVPINDPWAYQDFDTPEDYDKVLSTLAESPGRESA
jgi:molybdenum cofactor cytidylyltransferase